MRAAAKVFREHVASFLSVRILSIIHNEFLKESLRFWALYTSFLSRHHVLSKIFGKCDGLFLFSAVQIYFENKKNTSKGFFSMKRITVISSVLIMLFGGGMIFSAHAETLVNDKLKAQKEAFSKRASQEKKDDYEEGIRMVRDSGVLERAKNVGDEAPDFTLPNALGDQFNLYDALNDGPVVLIWYRGEWCPYCNIYLHELHQQADEFTKLGAKIVAVSPARPDKSWSVEDKEELKLKVLSDQGGQVAADYGIVYTLPPKIAAYYNDIFDLQGINNDDGSTLPLSASYVIDQNGIITYAYLNADYRERAEISDLFSAVQKISKGER